MNILIIIIGGAMWGLFMGILKVKYGLPWWLTFTLSIIGGGVIGFLLPSNF